MKAVIVEDEKAAVRNLMALLSEVAPEIEVVATLDSIVESIDWFCAQPQPDLVFMDIQMPVMNGYDAAKKIRQMDDPQKAGIPIIAMTANAFSEDRQAALDAGMNDHVAKPINMSILVPTIQKYL